jgi:Ca2+:H+ antiporter
VPAVAVVDIELKQDLVLGLGLGSRDTVQFAAELRGQPVTFGTGRTSILPGFVHLVIFATYIVLLFVP